ncbi:MAG: prolyl-tRNA synthetase associated domain-containing protein [bacterium]|nr:prolyl-tRNA synthetase associated domain-containing protein [bacterium]
MKEGIRKILKELNIVWKEFHHPPVFTCDESQLLPSMPGKKDKNLFLRDKKRQYYLITLTQDKFPNLKELGEKIGARGGLSFASEERLNEVLGIKPGCVGLLALINDTSAQTKVFIDRDLMEGEEWIQSHPGVNDETWCVATSGLPKFFEATGHAYQIIVLDTCS